MEIPILFYDFLYDWDFINKQSLNSIGRQYYIHMHHIPFTVFIPVTENKIETFQWEDIIGSGAYTVSIENILFSTVFGHVPKLPGY